MKNALFYTGPNLMPLQLILSSVDLAIAAITLILCIWLGTKRRELLKMTVFRVILALQLLGVLKCLLTIVAIKADTNKRTPCRWLTFLSLAMSMAPLYLSVFCTLYFQILLVNDISPVKKWPKWIMILGTLLFTFVPASFVLFIPPRIAGLQAYCSYSESIDTRTYVFKWLVSHLWIVLAGLIGIVSITTILVYIVRKCKDADIQTRGSSGSLDTLCTSDSSRRRTSSAIIVRTLLSIVWFPVMPIISLWFNVSYSTVRYKTQRSNTPMDALNIVFQFLQVPVMAMTFYASPCVKRAFKTYLSQGKSTKPAADDGIAIELPECSLHCYDIDNKARLYGARTPRIPSSTSSASTMRV